MSGVQADAMTLAMGFGASRSGVLLLLFLLRSAAGQGSSVSGALGFAAALAVVALVGLR